MKLIMENWRQYKDTIDEEQRIINAVRELVNEGLLEEGFLQNISAKSSNALKSMALAAAILAPMAPVGSVEAAPKAKVEKMVIQGKMTEDQKKELAQNEQFLKMELQALNEHLESERITNLDRSTRLMTLRMLGATPADFPFGQEVTKEELVKFLTTGEAPGPKDSPEPEESESEDPEYMQNIDAFLDDAEDAAGQVGSAVKKGAQWVGDLFKEEKQ